MKKLIPLLLLLLSFQVLCFSQTAAEREVAETEKRRFQAMVDKDFAVLEQIIGEDLYYLHSNGTTDTKATFIGGMRDGSRSYENITIEDLKVRVYHKNTAILNGACTYHRTGEDGQPNNLRLLYTNVYVKRNNKWQMVSWQSQRL
jgi:ketosteroid isomerase-like protein